jgi:hypothetical protein
VPVAVSPTAPACSTVLAAEHTHIIPACCSWQLLSVRQAAPPVCSAFTTTLLIPNVYTANTHPTCSSHTADSPVTKAQPAAAAAALQSIRKLLSVADFGPDSWAYWGGASANDRSWQNPIGGSWRSGGAWDTYDSWAGGKRRA